MENERSEGDLVFPPFFERYPPDLFSQDDRPPIDEEPLYVNAKQYFRILKRRVARTRLEEVHRLSRQRKVCLRVFSRHLLRCSPISMNLATNTPCVVRAAQVDAF